MASVLLLRINDLLGLLNFLLNRTSLKKIINRTSFAEYQVRGLPTLMKFALGTEM